MVIFNFTMGDNLVAFKGSEERLLCPPLEEGARIGYVDTRDWNKWPRIWPSSSRPTERSWSCQKPKARLPLGVIYCLEEMFSTTVNLESYMVWVWCRMISIPQLWTAVSGFWCHLTVWCGNRDEWCPAANGMRRCFAILMNPSCALQCPLNLDN